MKNFWKILLIVDLVLGIIAGGTAIVLKNMDEDKLIILESKVRPIQEGDKLEGYIFHVDAIKEMTEEDLEELIEGVDCRIAEGEGAIWEFYELVTLDCDVCDPYDELNPFDDGCQLSIRVFKISDIDSYTGKLNGEYEFYFGLGDECPLYIVGFADGVHGEYNIFTNNDDNNFFSLDAKGVDDYIFNFNELDWHEEELKAHTVISCKNANKLMKYIGGVFADE